jgi:hypothetical protein
MKGRSKMGRGEDNFIKASETYSPYVEGAFLKMAQPIRVFQRLSKDKQ